jgi:hypothetical protein
MSNFWESFPKSSGNEGIISMQKPFETVPKSLKLNEELEITNTINEDLTQETILFVAYNGLSPSGNSYIINPRSVKGRVNVVIKDNKDKQVLGFILSIPNTVRLNEQLIRSGLTTNNCVSLNHRSKNLSSMLISSVIEYGFDNEIYTGYHFVSKPRTESAIEVDCFFRPLNVKLARECGYFFPEKDYGLSKLPDYVISNARYDELVLFFNDSLNRRHLSVNLTREEYLNHLIDSEIKCITYKSKLIGIFIWKTSLLKIAKTSKICPVARLVYMECNEKHAQNVMSKIISYVSEDKKHIVLSGVCFGNLTDESVKYKSGLCASGKTYLDFYNLHINPEFRNAKDVNVMYV